MRNAHRLEKLWWRSLDAPAWSARWLFRLGFLTPLSWAYGAIVFLRGRASSPCPTSGPIVVAIGSVTVGGAGKTPVTAVLAQALIERGERVGVVLSGYGRTERGARVLHGVAADTASVESVGDEALVIGRAAPTATIVVDEDKLRGVETLRSGGEVSVILIDDALQTRNLEVDFHIAVLNVATPLSHYRLLPAGALRVGLGTLDSVDAIIVTNADIATFAESGYALKSVARHYGGALYSTIRKVGALDEVGEIVSNPIRSICLVSALARNDLFWRLAKERGFEVVTQVAFPDHHAYDERSVEQVSHACRVSNAGAILTTAKDWSKMRSLDWPQAMYILNQVYEIPDGASLVERILGSRSLRRNGDSR